MLSVQRLDSNWYGDGLLRQGMHPRREHMHVLKQATPCLLFVGCQQDSRHSASKFGGLAGARAWQFRSWAASL